MKNYDGWTERRVYLSLLSMRHVYETLDLDLIRLDTSCLEINTIASHSVSQNKNIHYD